MLKAHDLNAGYGRIPVLRGVRLNMAPGESPASWAATAWARPPRCAR